MFLYTKSTFYSLLCTLILHFLKLKYFIFICLFVARIIGFAQLGAPDLRCLSVATNGDVTLTWINTPDPTNIFTGYEIYMSPVSTGSFSLVGTVSSNVLTTFTHAGAAGAEALHPP